MLINFTGSNRFENKTDKFQFFIFENLGSKWLHFLQKISYKFWTISPNSMINTPFN